MLITVTLALLLYASPDGNVYADSYWSREDCEAALTVKPGALRCETRTEKRWINIGVE